MPAPLSPKNLFRAFNASALRQRAMIALAIFVAIHAGWDMLFYQPQLDQIDSISLTIEGHRETITKLVAIMQKIDDASKPDEQDRQIVSLKKQIEQLEVQIELASGELITPEQMPDVLEQLLTKNTKLKVTRLSTEPAIRVNKTAEQLGSEIPVTPIYKHTMTLHFEGDYLSALAYIQAIEKLDWTIFWDTVRIDSSDYPRTQVTISLYTLSLDEGWIGV